MSTPIDCEGILARSDLFANISELHRKALADICVPRRIPKNSMLFFEGDEGSAVYILVSGGVQLFKRGPDARRVVIKMVKPGELFGEVILFERRSYPVSAESSSESLLFSLPRLRFLQLLKDETFCHDFFANIMGKLRYLADQINYLTTHDVQDRLLLFLREQYGQRSQMQVKLSKKDVALAIATTPETLSRLLNRLKNEGLLNWSGKTVTVSDAAWGQLTS
jgi:CRP/FNR family transcriptional regulator